MQQSSMIIFCDECGAANEPGTLSCVACQHPLVPVGVEQSKTPVTPIVVRLPEIREVVAAAPPALAASGMPIDLFPGMVLFGRYQIRREIGRGGFSVVYLAEDLREGRRLVALKRISLRGLTVRQVLDATETCNREIKILSHLKSVDGVPTFYESFTDSENWYLMLEYIEGQTLEEYLHQTPGGYLSESEVVEIGQKLASLLQKIHARNVIFRDVKPANIMLTPQGKLYLIDFGVARFFTPGQKKDTTPLGSPGYAPPEQYGRAQTDVRADVYGLGATLQTLQTGRDPLELSQGELSRNPDQLSPRIRQVLDEMLAPEREQRPSRMSQIEWRLLRFSLANARNRWRLFFSVCAGSGFGALLYLGLPLLFQTFNTFPNFLQFILVMMGLALAIFFAIASLQDRTLPWERSIQRFFWSASRSVYGSFVLLGLACVLALAFIGWVIQFLLLLIRSF